MSILEGSLTRCWMVGLMVRYYPCQNRVNYSPKTKWLIILNYIFYMLHFQWNMISLPSFKNNISATFITGFIGIFFWVVIIKSPNQTNQPSLDNHQSSLKQNFLIAVNGATFKELLSIFNSNLSDIHILSSILRIIHSIISPPQNE